MGTDIVDPFGSSSVSYEGDLGTDPQNTTKDNTGLYLAIGFGVLLVGGLIAADMYRTSKGIRPVYVSPPMMPMGVYY